MNKFQKDFSLTIVKAIILTIIVVGVIASLSSCGDSISGNKKITNMWRGTVIKTGRHLTVKNIDSLVVMVGDTVTVFLNDGNNARPSYYYISNTPETAADTMTMEMYTDGKDTLFEPYEAWNVVLERRIVQ